MKKKIICLATIAAMASTAYAEEKLLPSIDVEADKIINATTSTLSGEDKSAVDGGDLLLQIPGISGVKMGAHGVDPVIRGQKHNQLNILLDGAYIHGGCPNRMDPPTSYASTDIYDEVTVLKGVQTLIHGGGGSGGTVLFERSAPEFDKGQKIKGKYGAGYRSNGKAWDIFTDISAGSNAAYLRGSFTAKGAEEYQDGDDKDVRSGYDEKSAMLSLGARTDSGTHYRLDIDAVRGEDILYAGANMDSPQADSDTQKLSVETGKVAAFETVKLEAYHSDVYHVMDNYSLRNNMMMWMKVPSESTTDGLRLIGDVVVGKGNLSLGVDHKKGDRDATRYMDNAMPLTDPVMSDSFMWPGVETSQTGLFAEYQGEVSTGNRYTAGLRYDSVEKNATKAALTPNMMLSPNALYTMYYGTTASNKTENNVGALYRMEHDMSKQTMFFWGVSRTMRTADETEQFMAANNSNTMMRWIGNPDIKPEAHNQLDVGVTTNGKNTDISVSAYYDDVSDYILRDRAHGQDGINQTDSATIYRNVDAELYGVDVEANVKWSNNWSSRFTAAYVHATNTTDDRAIAQTPPLEGTAALEYHQNKWMLGGEVRLVDKQTRVDDNSMTGSGLDAGQTSGFNVLNLYGSLKLGKNGSLRFGIDNIMDKTYAEHLNKPNAFDTTANQVNEPGRSVWARMSMKF